MEWDWIITKTEDLKEYSDKIFKMYENSYSKIGLIDFGGWNGLKDYLNCSCYLLIKKEDNSSEIGGIILYWMSDYGNKISLVISSDPLIGKTYVVPKLIELIQTPGFYIELSDALEHLVRKSGLDNIKDKEIIKKLIPGLSDEDIFDEHDIRRNEFRLGKEKSPSSSFLRKIKNIGVHRKALYGLPCLTKEFNKNGCDRKCITSGGKNKTKRKRRYNYKKTRYLKR